MNFLLHFELAERELGDPDAAFGAMLPDLWRIASRPARAQRAIGPAGDTALRAILRGVDHHLEVDAWFHEQPAFTDGERRTREALRAVATPGSRLGLFAHVTWEMCLDGALVRSGGAELRSRVAGAVSRGRDLAPRAAELHHGERRRKAGVDDAVFDGSMVRMFDAVESFALPAGYATAEGIALRLGGIRGALGLGRPSAPDLQHWSVALTSLELAADEALAAVLTSRRSRPCSAP